jgi:glyoxylase-like metal-dependent hydrolase (beta-lactamase superfamily II)
VAIRISPALCLCLFTALSTLVYAATPLPSAQITFPDSGAISTLPVLDYTSPGSPSTTCYLLAGASGQAIVIDPADELEAIPGKHLLADTETGTATLIDEQGMQAYVPAQNDAYGHPNIVRDPKTGKKYFVYDAFRSTGAYAPKILDALRQHHWTLKYIIITHGHLDHIGAVAYLREKTGATVLMHAEDIRGVDGTKMHVDPAHVAGYPKDNYRIVGLKARVDRVITDGECITLDGMVLRVIHTPGHTAGSICLLTRQHGHDVLFSGDTLFHWGLTQDAQGNEYTVDTGRTNFLDGSGDRELINRMVREKLFILPDDTLVLPEHGPPTTIGEEKKYGPERPYTPEDTGGR